MVRVLLGLALVTSIATVSVHGQSTFRRQAATAGATTIEVESLAGSAQTTSGKVGVQNMQGFGPGWSGGAQLFWGVAQQGAQLRLVFSTGVTGRYQVFLHFTRAPDFAFVRASLDGAPAVSFNGYATSVTRDRALLGMRDLTPGPHELLIEVAMKDGASKGYNVGLDTIELEPVAASASTARLLREAQRSMSEGKTAGDTPPPPAAQPSTSTATVARSAAAAARAGGTMGSGGAPNVVLPAKDPGPIGKGEADGGLNSASWGSFPQCTGNIPSAVQDVLALLTKVMTSVGVEAPTLDSRCGTYTREIAAGVTLGAPTPAPGQPPRWAFLGGRGELMADAMLCLLKDIGDRPGGRVENHAAVPVGIGKVELRQVVGLSKFDPVAKRAELFHLTKICAPLLGCLDAGRQSIVATVRSSLPAWPAHMSAGDYGIANSYALEVSTDWSATKLGASLPPITILTPYGQVSAKPSFNYWSTLLPIDTPFSYKKGSTVEFHVPNATNVAKPIVQDTYGRSGVPFILQVDSHLPPPSSDTIGTSGSSSITLSPPNARPSGWSSQLGFGGRDGASNAPLWNPGGGAAVPFRPDFDFGLARSELERTPAARFLAKAPVRFEPPNPKGLLPGAVQSILSGVELWVEVTPSFLADYAAQFGVMSREGRLGNSCLPGKGEFGQTCGAAESVVGLQAGALAEVKITGTVHLKLSFCCLGMFTPDDINVTKSFDIPLPAPDRAWDPAHITNAPMAHQSARVGWAIHTAVSPQDTLWQGVKGLSGATAGDVRAWTQACLATPPKNAGPPPPPSHEPDGDDLVPELLPCNLCVADSHQTKYNPFKLFEVTNYKPGVQASVCEWEPNAGCYDLCSWNGKSWNQVEVSAVTILGEKCAQHRPPVVK